MRTPRQVASIVLRRVGIALVSTAGRLWDPPPPIEPHRSPKELAHARWTAIRGDQTLRLQYPLQRNDIVLDVGGFHGQWSSDIFSRYLCRIHIFEPIPEFADQIAKRFSANDMIKLHRCALGAKLGSEFMRIKGDASSQVADHPEAPQVEIRTTTLRSVFQNEGIDQIALMKINIEGAEYDLLDDIISTGLIHSIRELQIQFHDFVPGAEVRMKSIQDSLSRTHDLTWQYYFTWENWRMRDGSK